MFLLGWDIGLWKVDARDTECGRECVGGGLGTFRCAIGVCCGSGGICSINWHVRTWLLSMSASGNCIGRLASLPYLSFLW